MSNDANGVAKKDAARLPLELQIIDLFLLPNVASVGPTDVTKLTELSSKGSASRALRTLADAGYLEEIEQGRYIIGGKLCTLYPRWLHQAESRLILSRQQVLDAVDPLVRMIGDFKAAVPEGGETQE